jgi:hypothetical protein
LLAAVWLLFGALHTLILGQFFCLKISVLMVHALSRSAIFFGLTLLLAVVITYGNFDALTRLQKAINYSFLAILSAGIWILLGITADKIFLGTEISNILLKPTIIYIPVGIMLYIIIVQAIMIQNEKRQTLLELENFSVETAPKEEILERVAIKSNSKIHVIAVNDIFSISSEGDYVQIHTENAKFLKEQTMKYFEAHLPDNFIRIHRSCIVNTEKISRVELLEKQTYYLILKNSRRIKMSVGGYRLLRQKLAL